MSVPDIEHRVCMDILRRQELGIAKYGQTVAANPLELREWLQHAYEETLDKAVYLRRAIAEIDRTGGLATKPVHAAPIVEGAIPDPVEVAQRAVFERHPNAMCICRPNNTHIVANGEPEWWAPKNRLGDGYTAQDAWLDAAAKLPKEQGA